MSVSSIQHVEAVLTQSELCESRRRSDGGLLRVVFPYHATQQRLVESVSESCVADDVSLCTCQRPPSYHHPGLTSRSFLLTAVEYMACLP